MFLDLDPSAGTWYYLVAGRDIHGNVGAPSNEASLVDLSAAGDAPAVFAVTGAVPNPFNPRTAIRFELPDAARTEVAVYDLRGRLVRVLIDEELGAGDHAVPWDGRDGDGRALSSGVYVALVKAGTYRGSTKLVLTN